VTDGPRHVFERPTPRLRAPWRGAPWPPNSIRSNVVATAARNRPPERQRRSGPRYTPFCRTAGHAPSNVDCDVPSGGPGGCSTRSRSTLQRARTSHRRQCRPQKHFVDEVQAGAGGGSCRIPGRSDWQPPRPGPPPFQALDVSVVTVKLSVVSVVPTAKQFVEPVHVMRDKESSTPRQPVPGNGHDRPTRCRSSARAVVP